MDKFIVSARKYRPQTFDTVVGQEHITTTLKNAIRNRQLAHAFLFCGPRGVGKTTCARILAKTINCENPGADGEACNQCHSCVSFNEGTSLNIHELDAASNNSVDDIRTLVEQVRFAPQAGKYKVYIIDEVHMLSSSAFNAFLKTLEEPPSYAIFILATTEKHKILPTILSRCQIFDFKRITLQDTVTHLHQITEKEHIKADKAALQVIAQKSEGCMRDALSIMDKIVSFTNGELTYQNTLEHLNILDADYYFRLMNAMMQQDLGGAMLLYDDINRKGFEGDLVLNGFAEFIRNLLVCKDAKVASLLDVVESFREKYVEAARQVAAAYLISALNVLNEAEINYKAARNKRLHVELALIKLTYLQQAIELAAGEEGLVKKKLLDQVKPVAFRKLSLPGAARPGGEAKKPAAARLIIESPNERSMQSTLPTGNNNDGQTGTAIADSGDESLVQNETYVKSAGGNETREAMMAEEPAAPVAKAPSQAAPATQKKEKAGKIGALANIREQFASKQGGQEANHAIALSPENLQQAWLGFTQQLKEKKNPAAQSFSMARLEIGSASSFEVVTNNNLEQKFIEQERRELSEYLQQVFDNKMLLFSIVVSDTPVEQEQQERPLNTREQFQRIAEQYPLVKELKDRLRLELDY